MHKGPEARGRGRRILIAAVVVAVAGYLGLALLVAVFQSRFVYMPPREILWTPREAHIDYEDLELTTADGGTINAWFVPDDGARGTLIFCHGNAENIGGLQDYIEFYRTFGVNVLVFDYRGYGNSSGKPSEKATYEDVLACWKYLTEKRGMPPEKIVVYGRSLGGAVAAWLAARERPRALILESAFTSVPDVAAAALPFLPVRLLAHIRYETKDYIRRVKCPVLVMHGPSDEVIPFEHGKSLFEIANEPKRFVEMKGFHNDSPWTRGEEFRNAVDEFLSARLGAATEGTAR